MSLSKELESPKIKDIFMDLDVSEFKKLRNDLNNETIILKFGATWCGPCQKIKARCEEWFAKLGSNVIIFDLNIDDTMELYMALKKYKMLNGIPAILAFHTKQKEDNLWYIPDDSVNTGDSNSVDKFFARVAARSIPQSP